MLVGLRNGSIMHVSGGATKEIMASHHDGEVWGLDTANGKVCTSGDDNQVIVWDVEKRMKESSVIVSNEKRQSKAGRASTLSHKPASQCSRAVICRDDGHIVVAANDGRVHVWDNVASSAPVACLEESREWI
jgi:WD40 repeat protein